MHLTFITIFFLNNLIPTYLERHSSKKIPSHGRNENVTSCCLGYVHTPGGGGGVLPFKGLMGTCGHPGYVFRDSCLEQDIDFIIFCLNQGQGMRGRAAPPHPRIYWVPPPRFTLYRITFNADKKNHPVCDSPVKRLGRRRFSPLQKSRRNHLCFVWTRQCRRKSYLI